MPHGARQRCAYGRSSAACTSKLRAVSHARKPWYAKQLRLVVGECLGETALRVVLAVAGAGEVGDAGHHRRPWRCGVSRLRCPWTARTQVCASVPLCECAPARSSVACRVCVTSHGFRVWDKCAGPKFTLPVDPSFADSLFQYTVREGGVLHHKYVLPANASVLPCTPVTPGCHCQHCVCNRYLLQLLSRCTQTIDQRANVVRVAVPHGGRIVVVGPLNGSLEVSPRRVRVTQPYR